MEFENTDFFYQATLRICGSLDLDTMLEKSYEYIRQFIPANGITLILFDRDAKTMNFISMIDELEFETTDKPIPLPPEAIAYLEKYELKEDPNALANAPETHPIGKLAWEEMGKPDMSYIISSLDVEDENIGFVSIVAKGRNRFLPKHLEMLNLLKGPFAIAMANGLKHMELMALKDILADDNRFLSRQLHQKAGDDIIGEHEGLKAVMEMVRQVAPLSSQVLLQGETGVGKEIIANAIHYASSRSDGPFIKVNCGAIPESLIDSELFGHEKGAFTGAVETKRGRFERADKGTIFLDEIGELPLQAQVRLLRVIQTREIERVGGTASIPVDIRIIAATHRNLPEMVKKGEFREDLWFRLNVFPITIPPLRHRIADIPALVDFFIERKSKEMNLHFKRSPAPGSIERLKAYQWPGNVRELENVVERALIRSTLSEPGAWLVFDITSNDTSQQEPIVASSQLPNTLKLDDMMKHHIEAVLEMTNGKVQGENGAAALMAINPSTLRKRMKKLGVPYGRQAKIRNK